MRDFYQRYIKPDADERHYLVASRICTLLWGTFCVLVALIFAHFGEATRQTTIVLINAVGSLLYGPILAAFVLGMMTDWAGPRAVKWGVWAGISVNLYLWLFTPISWLWWNLSGFVATVAIAYVLSSSRLTGKGAMALTTLNITEGGSAKNWSTIYKLVALYSLFIVLICYLIERMV